MKTNFFLVSLFILFYGLVFYFTGINKTQRINLALKFHSEQLETTYQTIKYHQRIVVTDTLEYIKNTSGDILDKIINSSEKEKELLRKELYDNLIKKYKSIKKSGVYQFQFTLANNKIFLRMHMPEKFDDDLRGIRYSIEYTNRTQKAISGFEGGKTSPTYRYIEPLFTSDNKYIGSVEVSFSSAYMQNYLTAINNIHSHLLIKKDMFLNKVWNIDDLKEKFYESSENKDFMFLLSTQHRKDVCIIDNKLKLEKYKDFIKQKMLNGKKFSLYTEHNDIEHYSEKRDGKHIDVISFLPIKNTDNQVSSWIVSYTIDGMIELTLKNVLMIRIILFMILIILFFLIYKILSQKKELENKVEEKTDELNRYFNLIKDGIAIADVQTKKFMDCNKAFEELTGYTKEELILLTIDKIHPKDSFPYVLREFEEQARKKKVIALNIPILHKSGKNITIVDVSTGSYDKNGLTFNVGIFRNISDRLILEKELLNLNKNLEKKVEDQVEKLRQKEILLFQQSKLAAMGEMLGNIAHQWRQPLSIISTSATGAKVQNELGLLTENNMNLYFDTINNSAQYLSQTIEDFRGFLNPKNSTEEEFHISDAITKALNLVHTQVTSKDIKIIQNIKEFKVLAVENELIQVLINILNNAKDTLIKLEKQKRLIFINAYKNDNNIVIEIKDNGNGISEDIINRVFEPYFTTKHQSQGTGIGLYMSEEIIRTHLNGSLTVSNDTYTYEGVEYKGANFTIKIPID